MGRLNRRIRIFGSGHTVGEVDHASHQAGPFRWRIAPVHLEHSSGGKDRTLSRIELSIELSRRWRAAAAARWMGLILRLAKRVLALQVSMN